MKARQLMIALVAALALVLAAGTMALAGGGKSGSSGDKEYRPGKGCGDRNHVHTGPPGNPSNKTCPPKSGQKTSTSVAAKRALARKACLKKAKKVRGKKAKRRAIKACAKKHAKKHKKAKRKRSSRR